MAVATAVIVGAVLSAGVSYMGQRQQAKAAKKQAAAAAAERQRAEQLQKRRDDIQAARQRRRAAAEARRFRASAVNLANNRGAGGAIGASGSTIPAVTGNIQSQLNYNNAFINRVTSLNEGIRTALGNAQTIASQPITAGMGLMAFGRLIGTATSLYASNPSAFNSPSTSALSNFEKTQMRLEKEGF